MNIPGYLHLQVIQVIQEVEYLLDSANFLGFIRGYDIRMWMWHVRSNYLWSGHGKGQLLSWFSSSGYIKCRRSKGRGDITCDTWNESTWYGKGLESSAGWSLDQLEPFQEVSNNKQTPGYFLDVFFLWMSNKNNKQGDIHLTREIKIAFVIGPVTHFYM